MILTTLRLSRTHRWARHESRDVHAMHVRVHEATDGHPTEPRILWGQPDRWTLIVRSQMPVPETAFPSGYLYAPPAHTETAPLPNEGDQVRWAVILNPRRDTKTRLDGETVRRRTVTDDPVGYCQPRIGAAVDGPIEATELPTARGRQTAHGNRLTHLRWMVTGHGRVTDPAGFAQYVTRGIGKARGYGCGLILHQPHERSVP